MPKNVKFAYLVCAGWVRRYEGEPIEGLMNSIEETEALNLLGAKGYDIYDVEKWNEGRIKITAFRLKTKPE